jgi:hypothetical protein
MMSSMPWLVLVSFQEARQNFGDQTHGEERLVDAIMQVARQKLPGSAVRTCFLNTTWLSRNLKTSGFSPMNSW